MRRLTCLFCAVACLVVAPTAANATTLPAIVGSISNNNSLSGADSVAVSGSVAYVVAYWTGQLTAIDIANPSNPTILGSTPPTASLENGTDVSIAGNYAFVTSKNRNASTSSNDDGTGNSLTIVDIANPSAPTVVGTLNNTNTPPGMLFGAYHVAVQGHYAYVAYQGLLQGQPTNPDTSQGGFSVIDITSPSGPTFLGNVDNASLPARFANALEHATSVAIEGNTAYVTAFYNQSLTAIDITNPTAPKVIGTLNHPTFNGVAALPDPNDVQVVGNYAYVACQGSSSQVQMTVVNISNPAAMSVVGTLSNPVLSNAYTIRMNGSVANVAAANSSGTVAEIDVSNPANPRLTSYVQDAARLYSVTGLAVDSTGDYLVTASPLLASDPQGQKYPPFTDTTGTVSVIQVGTPPPPSPPNTAPSNTAPPAISGRPLQHSRLSGSLGTWAGSPTPGLSAKWLRCNRRGLDCTSIAGANGSTYTLTAADVGSTIRFAVTAANVAGSATAQSSPTGVVKANASGALTGVGQRRATLHLTATAPSGGRIARIAVSLPHGLRLVRGRGLTHGVRVTPGAKRLAFTALVRGGSLVLRLRQPLGTASVTIPPSAVYVSPSLARKVRNKRIRTLTVTVTLVMVGGQTIRTGVVLRV